LSRLYLIDSNVYIRAFREAGFGADLQAFHRLNLARLVVSAVVASELLVGAQKPDRERAIRRTLVEPFRSRGRLLTPTWSTWELASRIDRGIRRQPASRTRLNQRSFMQDILIAATAREVGATIISENTADFALIGRHVDIAFVPPWPPKPLSS
jgi:predicted nucleic acid-binding protein